MLRPHPIVYVAAQGREEELVRELGDARPLGERLYSAPGPERPAVWARNVWQRPSVAPVESISEAARRLKSIQRNWALHPLSAVRRSHLVADKLPPIRMRPRPFPSPLPTAPLGAFTLLDRDQLLFSPSTRSPFPHGVIHFDEDRTGPPSRAYLKLWEALTLLGEHPRDGDRCLDLGASPGGWTYALARLGAEVVSVDKAPLDDRVEALPNVSFRRESAFAIEPADVGPVDWLLSDVICYPPRLHSLIERWIASGLAARILCTIKLQGASDEIAIPAFTAIAGAEVRHLFHNKHELTFFWRRDPGPRFDAPGGSRDQKA